jgi:hypothetical protein
MAFRWRSLLGVGVVFFLLYGALNFLAAIYVPLTLQAGGAGALGMAGVIFSQSGDNFLLGRPLDGLRQGDAKLDALLVSSMQSMCSQMIGLAVLFLAVTWFALRRGRRWALWALGLCVALGIPHYALISSNYAAQGANVSDGLAPLIVFWVIALAGFVASWIGLPRLPTPPAGQPATMAPPA